MERARQHEPMQPVTVRFALEHDEYGWPPAESEGLWAFPLGGGLYRLDNTPWFARGVAAEDVVETRAGTDGVPWFVRVVHRSGRLVVRVIPSHGGGPLGGNRQAVLSAFAPLGVRGEGMSSPVNMVALDIGPDAPLAEVKSLLADGESDGRWDYEEGCVTQEWNDIP